MSVRNSIVHELRTTLNQSSLADFDAAQSRRLAYLEKIIYRVAHVVLAVLALIEFSLKYCLCLAAYSFSIITTPFEFVIMKIYSFFEHSEEIDVDEAESSTPFSSLIYNFAYDLSCNMAEAFVTSESCRHYVMFGIKFPND